MARAEDGGFNVGVIVSTKRLVEDDGEVLFFASSDQTPGCWGSGDTEIEALDDYCVALVGWVEVSERLGHTHDLPPVQWTWSAAA